MIPKRKRGWGFTKQTKSVKHDKNQLSMFPKRTLWAVDRHTLNILVQNKIVKHIPSTKSKDLYYEQLGVVIGSASCFLLPGTHVGQCGSSGQINLNLSGEIKEFFQWAIPEKSQTGGGAVEDMELPDEFSGVN